MRINRIDVLFFAGMALIVGAVWQWSRPSAVLIVGIAAVMGAVFFQLGTPRPPADKK